MAETAEQLSDVEQAIESMAAATDASRGRGTFWVAAQDVRTVFNSYLGTTAPNPWICPLSIEVALRLFPAAISPDSCVVVANRWTSGPDEPLGPGLLFFYSRNMNAIHQEYVTELIGGLPEFDAFLEGSSRTPQLVGFDDPRNPPPELERADPLSPPGSSLARDLRAISDLDAATLASLCHVSRETYQRWLAGAMQPARRHLNQLASLKALFEEIRARFGSVELWLVSPIRNHASDTPMEWLTKGRLAAVWDEVLRSPAESGAYQRSREPNGVTIHVSESSRAPYAPTPPTENDDLTDWPDEEDGE